MAHDVISTCPVCANELAVTRLHCRSCGTTLEGDFSVGRFGRLSREQLASSRASCAPAATCATWSASSGISYPTVRSRVEALVRALGFGPRDGDDADDRRRSSTVVTAPADDAAQEILEALARHEMSAEDAATAIRALGRTRHDRTTVIHTHRARHRHRRRPRDPARRQRRPPPRGIDGTTVRVSGATGTTSRVASRIDRGDRQPVASDAGRRRRSSGEAWHVGADTPDLDDRRRRAARRSSSSRRAATITADWLHRRPALPDRLGRHRPARGRRPPRRRGGVRRRRGHGRRRGGDLSARTVSGDLAAPGRDHRDARGVTTTSGDIRIAGPARGPGPFAIEIVSGDALLALAGDVRVELQTVAGDIRSEIRGDDREPVGDAHRDRRQRRPDPVASGRCRATSGSSASSR